MKAKKKRKKSVAVAPKPAGQDRIDAINKLIKPAWETAQRRYRKLKVKYEYREGHGGQTYRHCFLTQFYHEEMNRMAKEEGLR